MSKENNNCNQTIKQVATQSNGEFDDNTRHINNNARESGIERSNVNENGLYWKNKSI